MINGNVTWHLKGGWMLLTNLILFLIGVLVGFVIMTVWACIIVGAEADERDKKMFEEWKKKNETNR